MAMPWENHPHVPHDGVNAAFARSIGADANGKAKYSLCGRL